MAPNRLRAAEDSRSESSNAAGRQPAAAATSNQGTKGKRAAVTATAPGGSNLKDVTSAIDPSSGPAADSASSGTNWSSFPTATLSAYRHAHRLDTPASYASLSDQALLNHPRGLGRHAPSMIGRQRASSAANGLTTGAGVERRIPKEQLALAVRKDFNAAAVNEAEVVTNFLYVVKNKDRKFRMRFAPGKK